MSKYRRCAHTIAIFEMLTPLISAVIFLGVLGNHRHIDNRILKMFAPTAGLVTDPITWICCAVCAILAVVYLHLWSASRLLDATETDQEPVKALRLASAWIYATFLAVVIDTISVVALGLFLFAIHLLLRVGIMIFIVFPFMQELQVRSGFIQFMLVYI